MNRHISAVLLLFCFVYFSIAQNEYTKQHEAFNYLIKKEKIDSFYAVYSNVEPSDKNYIEALIYRNQFGWALGKTAQLKNDIPAILNFPAYSKEFSYAKIFRPQKFPASEWSRFYYMSDTLCNYFSKDTSIYKELLGTKVMLELLTKKDAELLIDLPVLAAMFDTTSKEYGSLMWEYGKALLRTNQREKAYLVFEKTYWSTSNNDCFQSMLRMYDTDKSYGKIVALKSEILKDSSGVMLYDLAFAYMKLNQPKEAKICFDAFASKIEMYPYARIQWGNTVYPISSEQLETLGDFYQSSDKSKSCDYYQLAIKALNSPTSDMRLKKQLAATNDEKERQEIQQLYDDHLKSKEVSLVRIAQKSKKCK